MLEKCNEILYRENRNNFSYKRNIRDFNLQDIHILLDYEECFLWIMNEFKQNFHPRNILSPQMRQIFPHMIRNEGHLKSCCNALEKIGSTHFSLSVLNTLSIKNNNLISKELGLSITERYLTNMAENNCYISWILQDSNFCTTQHVDDLLSYISTMRYIPNKNLSPLLLNNNVTASQMEKIIEILKKGQYNFRYLDILDNENVRYSIIEAIFDKPELQDLIEESPSYLKIFINLVKQEPLVTQYQAIQKFPFLVKYGINITELDVSIDFLKELPNDT